MGQAFNPFLPLDVYIADGEPHVFGDRLYLFGSHDAEGGDSFCLLDYEVWSAPVDDLTDWSCPGPSYSAAQDPLCTPELRYLYAPDVARGNDGRYYLYYCLAGWKGAGGYSGPISVAVCDTPDGHYEYLGVVRNPDGTPYLDFVCFDPAVLNDGGTIRLYFGTGPFRAMAVKPWNAWVLGRVYEGIFGRPAKAFSQYPGPLGANAAQLCDDMLTLKGPPKRIADTKDFRGHAFFEASSIRKIGETYYFVYSSQNNHELCYATSKYPDRGFAYRGVLVSNGDVGIGGRTERQRANATGTTHGGIERVNGQWYVFYHRLTHGSDYSRQACAEKLELQPDGSFSQAEMTSCGLNRGDLAGEGSYPAAICCHLTNGHMPHIANQKRSGIPMVTHSGRERFVGHAGKGTRLLYRYFDLRKTRSVSVTARGAGVLQILFRGTVQGELAFENDGWEERTLPVSEGAEHSSVCLPVTRGHLDILSFTLKEEPQ